MRPQRLSKYVRATSPTRRGSKLLTVKPTTRARNNVDVCTVCSGSSSPQRALRSHTPAKYRPMPSGNRRQSAAASAAMTWPGSDATLRTTRYRRPALMTNGRMKRSVCPFTREPKASACRFGQGRAELARGELFAREEDQAEAGDERVLHGVRDDDQGQGRLGVGANGAEGGGAEEL